MIDRRTALLGGGGAVVIGLGVRAIDQGLIIPRDRPGLAAWHDWQARRYAGPLALVSAGILAASPHNTQPWRFALSRYGVDVFEDPTRALGAMDPFGRERLLGLGAAVHNMALATTSIDRRAAVKLLPDAGNPQHVATIELGPEGERTALHPLLGAIGRRHTDRGPYRGGAISAGALATLLGAARSDAVRIAIFPAGSARGQRFGALTIDATAAIAADSAMMAASHAWFRHGRREQDRSMDGLSLATAGLSPWLAAAGAILPAQSAATEGEYWLAATRDTAVPTASAFGMIMVADIADRRSLLLAGAAWQRLHLLATELGLAVQPLNQLPEMIDRQRQLRQPPRFAKATDALLDDPLWRPAFGFRIGHPLAAAAASPRRPVSVVIGQPARLDYDVARAGTETRAQEAALARRLR